MTEGARGRAAACGRRHLQGGGARLIVLALVVLAGAAVVYAYVQLWRPALASTPMSFTIAEGSGLRAAAMAMRSAGVLRDAEPLILLGRITGAHTRVRAGHYELQAPVTLWELLQKITRGDVTLSEITFVEGWTLRQWRAAMHAHPDLNRDASPQGDSELALALGLADGALEGWLFPDTYLFTRGTTDRALIVRAHRAMVEHLEREWRARATDIAVKSPYEALILASIIEKETGRAADRTLISGVFHNRLKAGMRLQTDPTVIYGLDSDFDGNLRRRDLQHDTAFNTYIRAGLPPTPIAMPGLASLRAALHPEPTRALYFVARGDGTSEFSQTLADHSRAVRKYQSGPAARPSGSAAR
ncbi:MAG: endolytic transglycosylase MltG [Proteobacteria bacterium]|nr:endolytic transglycosylase MltG [Burkholderiales bacterium]